MTKPLLSRQKLTAVRIEYGYTCDFHSNANCDPSGETSYGLTSADSRSLASPPFDDGWDTKIMSLRCYAMQDFSMRETVFERSDSNPLEEEDKENLEISKVDTTLPRRSLPNQVLVWAADDTNIAWVLTIEDHVKECFNTNDHV
ncbi:hypothetical protein EG328_005970 [Venturia inaequalis]|nr:hypothetical protein EG328_005970 [Venturia inaequalis]RDI76499.1 hypothetical protein Vi05172_g13508 [Venturia inaequalis]